MDPERHRIIERLAADALTRNEEQRSAFLTEACAGDEGLRREVEFLIASARTTTVVGERSHEHETLQAAPGQTIGRYRIQSLLGAGGMGEVWLATDTMLGRKVALKLLRSELAGATERLHRFFLEAKAASALNHPNIITIYEIGAAEGIQFIATEFVDGVTLRHRIAGGPMEMAETLAVVKQISAALESAHKAGIVHRDIKPENIMVRPEGLVKVLDFGLARVTEPREESLSKAPADHIRTDPGKLMGTLHYMSPEQARGLPVDSRSDIFSFGIVLYEMLTGNRPFQGATSMDVLVAIVDKPAPPLTHYVPDAPAALQRIVGKALEKDANARYASIKDLSTELQAIERTRASGISAPGREPEGSPRQHAASVPRRRGAIVVAAAFMVLAGLGTGIYLWLQGPVEQPQATKISPLIGLSGRKANPAFSPDESRIAFAWDGGTNEQVAPHDIYVKEIGAGEPLRLTTAPEDDIMPVWTPDGRYITFERVMPDHDDVYRVPASGGKEQKIAETLRGSSWSPNGKTLAVDAVRKPGIEAGIFLVSIDTGASKRLTTAPAPATDQGPVFSPDGSTIAFQRHYRDPGGSDILVVPVSGGAPKNLTLGHDVILSIGMTWTADSREVIFTPTRGGSAGLWRIPLNGGAMRPIPVPDQNPGSPTISRSGRKLAWSVSSRDSNIWRSEGPGFAGHPTPEKFGPLKPMLTFPGEDHSPQFSPDGQRIVFSSGRTGGEDLWTCDRDGHNLLQLTTQHGPTGSPHWSPDGRWITFDAHTEGSGAVYVIGSQGGPWRRLTFGDSRDVLPSWSHDGRWIYFYSNRTGRGEYYRMPSGGGTPVQLTHTGAFEAFESPDGKVLYFTKGRGVYGIWSVPVEGGPETPVPELSRAGYWRSWGVMKEGIYFISKESGPPGTIRFFSFATRRIMPLLTVDKEPLWWQAGLAISPDGRTLLYSQLDHAVDEIMLMENFR
jgi:Tol biopolymer transport system component